MSTTMILASASPRRKELLAQLDIAFEVQPAPIDELQDKPSGLAPHCWVVALAYFKAASVARTAPDRAVLGADTIVACQGQLLGKPRDIDDARRMLELQAAAPSTVLTGVALLSPEGAGRCLLFDATRIWMHDKPALRDDWLASGDWQGKAGAYGIQDVGDQLVARCEGSTSNVVGLPLERLRPLLTA